MKSQRYLNLTQVVALLRRSGIFFSADQIRRRVSHGKFPPPAGVEHSWWWQESTVTGWAADQVREEKEAFRRLRASLMPPRPDPEPATVPHDTRPAAEARSTTPRRPVKRAVNRRCTIALQASCYDKTRR
jgi:hypothetical protein